MPHILMSARAGTQWFRRGTADDRPFRGPSHCESTLLGAGVTSINFCGTLGSHGKRMTIGATGRIRAMACEAKESEGQQLADLTLPTMRPIPCRVSPLPCNRIRGLRQPLDVLNGWENAAMSLFTMSCQTPRWARTPMARGRQGRPITVGLPLHENSLILAGCLWTKRTSSQSASVGQHPIPQWTCRVSRTLTRSEKRYSTSKGKSWKLETSLSQLRAGNAGRSACYIYYTSGHKYLM